MGGVGAVALIWSVLAVSATPGFAAGTSGKPITGADQEVKGCPTTGGTLRVDLDEDLLPDLDPSYTPAAASYRVIRGVFDSLVYENDKGQFSPWLASKWTVNPTDTSYTFTLRPGVKFSDGTPLDANAVKYTFDRIESPAEGSLFAIALLGPYAGSVVNGPDSVTVNFKTPYPAFLEAASQAFLGIVSPTAAMADGPAGFGEKPVGSGPFVITSNIPNQSVTETRNPDYDWGPAGLTHKGAACVGGITFTEVPQSSTRIGQLTKGDVDAAETILPPDYQTALIDEDVKLYAIAGAGASYQYLINTHEAPWTDEQLRLALRDAIDIPAILKAVYQGEYTEAWSSLMPKTADYDASLVGSWSYAPKKAKSILSAAGWKLGSDGYRHKDGQTLSISFVGSTPDRELRQEVSVYIQSELKEVGIKEDITNYEGTSALTVEEAGNYGMTAVSFITASPTILFDYFDSSEIPIPGKSGQNASRLDNPTVDQWLTAAEASTNPATAQKDWDQVQKYVVDHAVSIPIELEPFILATSNSVHGLTFDRRDYPIYYGVWLAK
ncbi:MAG TPA: ABC transporter substrate-binding protein [Acidimicrobiales bacterium]|jgi:peptide/nickel transport system substrate-binding protein